MFRPYVMYAISFSSNRFTCALPAMSVCATVANSANCPLTSSSKSWARILGLIKSTNSANSIDPSPPVSSSSMSASASALVKFWPSDLIAMRSSSTSIVPPPSESNWSNTSRTSCNCRMRKEQQHVVNTGSHRRSHQGFTHHVKRFIPRSQVDNLYGFCVLCISNLTNNPKDTNLLKFRCTKLAISRNKKNPESEPGDKLGGKCCEETVGRANELLWQQSPRSTSHPFNKKANGREK